MEKADLRRLDVGMAVRYCSEDRVWYDALITAIHGEPRTVRVSCTDNVGEVDAHQYPCVNLSFVSSDENAKDQYGRQMVRDTTSITHYGQYVASGFFWCHKEDEEVAFKRMGEAMKNIQS